MAAVFHGYCKFLQQKTHGMSKQLPNKSNKTQWVCPKMGYAQHHISPSFRKKKYAPFWDTPEFSALKLCQTFCTTEGAGLHHLVTMCSMCVHATKNNTCINGINMCNAMQRYVALFPLKTLPEICWDLRSALDLRRLYWKKEFQSAICFRHLCAREWLKKMFADKTELWEHEIWNETVRKLTWLLLAPLLQRGPGVLAETLTSHWDAWSCKRLSYT